MNAGTGEGRMDWDWLQSQPVARSEGAVRHVRLQHPLQVMMDGRTRRGLILAS